MFPGRDEARSFGWSATRASTSLNGKLAEGATALNAEDAIKRQPDYWQYKRQHFGGDDGVEFLDGAMLVKADRCQPRITHLGVVFHEDSCAAHRDRARLAITNAAVAAGQPTRSLHPRTSSADWNLPAGRRRLHQGNSSMSPW
ncbi:DUF3085 domain-containing protein [Agrobacterium tumefaciens]|uniref:DUF3085 domain-containing protein n=1 Tax=Agrobacterium tumefaciens TaxID=358 RepID=UPI0021D234C8|nr:DUF3085 domain-containing protein [Agrobacterium tumefaciens]